MALSENRLVKLAMQAGKLDHLALLEAIFENAPVLISAKDLSGNILFVNREFEKLDGPSPEVMIGKNIFDIFPYEIAKSLWDNDVKAQTSQTPVYAEETVLFRDGSRRTYHTTKFRLTDKCGETIGTCAVSTDITERKRFEFDAYHDYLTGLLNRRFLSENMPQDLIDAGARNLHFTLALIDLDGFKKVNDDYGHAMGDAILEQIAKVLVGGCVHGTDKAYRLGGDEFAVTFSTATTKEALVRLKRLHTALNGALANALKDTTAKCTNSIGVKTVRPNEHFDFSSLLADVDEILYRAKHNGKNGVYTLNGESS